MSTNPMVSNYAYEAFCMAAVLVSLIALLIGVLWSGWRKR